jgi:hypothetical protein
MAPKKGDLKTINGETYRWAWSSKQKKFTWVRDHSKDKLSAKEGLRTKEIAGSWKNTTQGIANTASKLGLHNKRDTSSTTNQKYKSDKWTKPSNTQLKTWRVDNKENKQLQTERKGGKDETYTRVTSKNKETLSNQVDKPSSKNRNRLGFGKIGSLKIGKGGFSARQIDRRIKNLKRKNKASNRMKIKQLEALKKKKYGS